MCALYISETSWPFACMDFNFVDLNVTAWAERRVLNVACYYKPLAAATNTLTTHTALSTANAAQSAFQHRKVLSACPFPWSITEHFISPLPFRSIAESRPYSQFACQNAVISWVKIVSCRFVRGFPLISF